MDARHRCVYANAAAERLTGYRFEELQGRRLHDVVQHHMRPDGRPTRSRSAPSASPSPSGAQERRGTFRGAGRVLLPRGLHREPGSRRRGRGRGHGDRGAQHRGREGGGGREAARGDRAGRCDDRPGDHLRRGAGGDLDRPRPPRRGSSTATAPRASCCASPARTPNHVQVGGGPGEPAPLPGLVPGRARACARGPARPARGARRGGARLRGEDRLRRRQPRCPSSATPCPSSAPDGTPRGSVAAFVDVTARRRAEAALPESEERFRNMADHAPVMMWVTRPDGVCTYLNREWYDFTGQTPEEARGLRLAGGDPSRRQGEAERVFLEANAAQAPVPARVPAAARRREPGAGPSTRRRRASARGGVPGLHRLGDRHPRAARRRGPAARERGALPAPLFETDRGRASSSTAVVRAGRPDARTGDTAWWRPTRLHPDGLSGGRPGPLAARGRAGRWRSTSSRPTAATRRHRGAPIA